MRTWITGVVAALVGLIGLFIASRAHEGTFYYVGLALFAIGVGVNYWLIARNTGHPYEHRPGREH